VVHALFKGGDASEFDNYRGITVGPILAKLFVMILDKRWNEWFEQHGLRAKGHAKFHKDYHTTDQLFILRTLLKQSKAKKKATLLLLCGLQKGVRYCAVWNVVASVSWLRDGGTFLPMPTGDVCQRYHMHQPPKRRCHLQLQMLARCEARLPSQPPIVWAIFGCLGKALGW
jgi:hypothetical protein